MVHQARKARIPATLNRRSVPTGLASAFCCSGERWYSMAVQDRGTVMKKFCAVSQSLLRITPQISGLVHTSHANR